MIERILHKHYELEETTELIDTVNEIIDAVNKLTKEEKPVGPYTTTGYIPKTVSEDQDMKEEEGGFKIVPSGRIDYCSSCKLEHGYDCPLSDYKARLREKVKMNSGSEFISKYEVLDIIDSE